MSVLWFGAHLILHANFCSFCFFMFHSILNCWKKETSLIFIQVPYSEQSTCRVLQDWFKKDSFRFGSLYKVRYSVHYMYQILLCNKIWMQQYFWAFCITSCDNTAVKWLQTANVLMKKSKLPLYFFHYELYIENYNNIEIKCI